jgi:hypothetical protein
LLDEGQPRCVDLSGNIISGHQQTGSVETEKEEKFEERGLNLQPFFTTSQAAARLAKCSYFLGSKVELSIDLNFWTGALVEGPVLFAKLDNGKIVKI